MLERAADDGGGVLVVVDGVFSMEGDVAPLPRIVELCKALRRAADGRRGARRRRARRARRGRARAVRRRGRRRPADGHVLASRWRPAAASSPARTRSSTSCASPRARSCSPPPACPAAVGAALAALRIIRSPEGPQLFARVLDNAALPARGLHELGFQVVDGEPDDHARSCPSWSATTGRPCCSGARSTTPASTSTSRIHPAVPPGGALLRTSVMATHDRADAGPRARRVFETSSRTSKPSTDRSRPASHSRFTRTATPDVRKKRALCECGGWLSVESGARSAASLLPGRARRADAPERDTGHEAELRRSPVSGCAVRPGLARRSCARARPEHVKTIGPHRSEGGTAGRFDGRNCDSPCAAAHAGARAGQPRPAGARRAQAPGGDGEATVAEIVLECPWEAESMAIADLLMSQHRWGRTRCRRFLASIPMIGDQDDRLDDRAPAQRAGRRASAGSRSSTAPRSAGGRR